LEVLVEVGPADAVRLHSSGEKAERHHLTIAALNPIGKIPRSEVCIVIIEFISASATREQRRNAMSERELTVRELMVTKVSTIGRNDTLDLADDLMTMARIRHLPVLDEGHVVGVVSQRDLFRSALAVALGYGERAQKALLKTLPVKEVMSEPAITIAADATVKEATRLMLEHKIGCLPVAEGHALVGIVTETDLLRATVTR